MIRLDTCSDCQWLHDDTDEVGNWFWCVWHPAGREGADCRMKNAPAESLAPVEDRDERRQRDLLAAVRKEGGEG